MEKRVEDLRRNCKEVVVLTKSYARITVSVQSANRFNPLSSVLIRLINFNFGKTRKKKDIAETIAHYNKEPLRRQKIEKQNKWWREMVA